MRFINQMCQNNLNKDYSKKCINPEIKWGKVDSVTSIVMGEQLSGCCNSELPGSICYDFPKIGKACQQVAIIAYLTPISVQWIAYCAHEDEISVRTSFAGCNISTNGCPL